jgi:peptide deformylase
VEFEILTYPDERLKQASKPVEVFDTALVEWVHAFEAFMRTQPGGVGIAAPQVGRFERILIVDVSGRKKTQSNGRMVLINSGMGWLCPRSRGLHVGAGLHRQCRTRGTDSLSRAR